MPSKRLAVFVASFSVILGSLAITTPLLAASKEKVLYSFCSAQDCTDGDSPSGIVSDAAGNLYVTASYGGIVSGCSGFTCGTVLKLVPSNEKWTATVIHRFNGKDGANPYSGVIVDKAGNLYGTTKYGGADSSCDAGCGTVFQLAPNSEKWTERLLHSFSQNGKDGTLPYASLLKDKNGNLFGTTLYGGPLSGCHGFGCGTAFELSPSQNGKWAEKILQDLHSGTTGPAVALIMDMAGNLYGTTVNGGMYGNGTVFELVADNGKWTYKVLHTFKNQSDGFDPDASLILDQAGNLYGTASEGGPYSYGVVFELARNNGKWTYKVLHSFNGKDGSSPSRLILDPAGNLYGTAQLGSNPNCFSGNGCGAVFELTLRNGRWTEKVLYSFTGKRDGAIPSDLIRDAAGKLYGIAAVGGLSGCGGYGCGVVWEITP
jgi:uncharacterized repeat protein (TIGR03803 family)